MDDPFAILGVAPDAPETDIRKRYLELVRKHSPDRDPERFREIRQAYDAVSDPETRLDRMIFQSKTDDSLERLLSDTARKIAARRIPVDTLLQLSETR